MPFQKRLNEKARDWCVVILLALIVATVFYKTLFLGQPISRLSQLSKQDPVFGPPLPGVVSDTYDRAAYFKLVPNYLLTGQILRDACLPLWNPYSECGSPLLADDSSYALAPLRVLTSPWSSLRLYNLIFVLYALIGCIGTFVLARSLGLKRYSSFFAALAYGFCPYILFSFEIGLCSWFLPVLFWTFVRLAKSPGLGRAIVAGLCCTFAICSSHCESVFFAIAFASLWATLAMATDVKISAQWHMRLLKAIALIAVAGVVAFCFSAPMLLPFIEYLTHSDCYKSTYDTTGSAIISWQTLTLCFTYPALGGASPFLGILAAALIPLSLTGSRTRELIMTVIAGIVVFATVCRLGPMDWLLSTRALSWFGTGYCLPVMILLAAILSSFGLEALRALKVGLNWRFLLFVASTVMVALAPVIFNASDLKLVSSAIVSGAGSINPHWWLKDIFILSALPVMLIARTKLSRWMPYLVALLIALNFLSMSNATSKALPVQPDFQFKNESPLPFLEEKGQRVLGVGRATFCPNTNVVYRIPSLLSFNVYHPLRVLPFMKNCGITLSGLTEMAEGRLTKLVDLASVKYVLSCYPVLSRDDLVQPLPSEQEAIHFGSQVTLKRFSVQYDPINHDATGRLEWQVSRADCARFIYSAVVTDQSGRLLWVSGPSSFVLPANVDKGICQEDLAVSLPIQLAQGTNVAVGIQVLDLSTFRFVPVSPPTNISPTVAKLAEFTIKTPPSNSVSTRHFRLVWETDKANQLRLYENTRALPQAYLVHEAIMAESKKKALDLISADSFNPRREAVIEGALSNPYPQAEKQQKTNSDTVSVKRTDPNHVYLQVSTNQAAILVLTDTFYPGWVAYLNGKEVPILHANYLFRAIQIPPGKQLVEFAYRPLWFGIGVLLACLCLVSILVFLFSPIHLLRLLGKRFNFPETVGLGQKARDWCVVILLALIVATVFYKTLFLGQPISRISQLSKQDPVFGPPLPGLASDIYDRAAYFQLLPNYLLTGQILRDACLPLWNPYSECGTPLLADDQSFALAPLRVLTSPWSSLRLYNLIFVLYALIGCIGTFVLARSLGLKRYSAFFAALAYGFCPYILFSFEIGLCSWFLPVLFWTFVRLAKSPGIGRAIVAGLCCAFAICSSHCESVFFAIAFASLWATLAMATDVKISAQWHMRLLKAVALIAVAGVVAFCFSAPMLLPFIEYLTHSDCYKSTYDTTGSAIISWQTLALCFTYPALGGASPFLGILAAALIPLSLTGSRTRELIMTVIAGIVVFATVCRLGPMDWLLNIRALSWFGTGYCLPVLILLAAILSSFGLEALRTVKMGLNWRCLLIVVSIILVALAPVIFDASGLKLVSTAIVSGAGSINPHLWLKDLLMLSILLLVLIAGSRLPKWTPYLVVLFIALNFVSMSSAISKALPVQPSFQFNNEAPLPFLEEKGQRVLGVGRATFCPNTNVVYRIPSLLSFNVYHPLRVLPFMKNCGITLSGLTEMAEGRLTKLVDLASVKYVLSCYPVLSRDDLVQPLPSGQEAIHFGSQVTLKRFSVQYDPTNHDATGQLEWQVSRADCARFIYSAVVTDKSGRLLWVSGPSSFALPANVDKGLCQEDLAVSLPIQLAQGTNVAVGIQVLDLSTFRFVTLPSSQSSISPTVAKLAEFTIKAPPSNSDSTRHFRLVWETDKANQLRLYENTRALPQAYLVHSALMADSKKKALELISADSFNPRREAVIEGALSNPYPQVEEHQNINSDTVSVKRTDPNHVSLQVSTNQAAILVLTDTFYPGWVAYLNGKEVPILHANYLFRAIQIPPGKHLVEFAYRPAWFGIGVLLACLCLLGILVFLFKSKSSNSSASA